MVRLENLGAVHELCSGFPRLQATSAASRLSDNSGWSKPVRRPRKAMTQIRSRWRKFQRGRSLLLSLTTLFSGGSATAFPLQNVTRGGLYKP